jgi:predicted RNA-binding Zn-ribbon protein involved in translation (DUF1610 family)
MGTVLLVIIILFLAWEFIVPHAHVDTWTCPQCKQRLLLRKQDNIRHLDHQMECDK